jgi:hypothetical protein
MVGHLKGQSVCRDIACRFLRDRLEQPIEGWDERSEETEVIRHTNLRAIGIPLAALGEAEPSLA